MSQNDSQISRKMIDLMLKEDRSLFALWEEQASKNDSRARYLVSQCYRRGVGTEVDEKKEIQNLEVSALYGNDEAFYTLGTCHEDGHGVPFDMSIAADRYMRAANMGHAEAANKLAWIQMFGAPDVPANSLLARLRLEQAANHSHAFAMLYYADLLYYDKGALRDTERAIDYWERAAQYGLSEARDRLLKIKEDKTEAETIYLNAKELHSKNESFISQMTVAARKGLACAQYELGKAILPLKEDIYKTAGYSWLRAAAEQGHTDALHLLAQCYMNGTGVKQSTSNAIRLWEMCFLRGGRHAAYHLARIHERGIGVERDLSKALNYFEMCYLWDDEYPVFERERCRDRIKITD